MSKSSQTGSRDLSLKEQTMNADDLQWTGERFLPSVGGQIRYEHVHRYAICADLCADRRVLDIACGEGYGSAYLSNFASSVVGVDVDKLSVNHASAKYAHLKNIEFRLGSVDAIPLADDSVDVVVSFETIEHVSCHQEMLAEIKRVLKDDGVLIISTPDKEVYSEVSGDYNEFHVKELYAQEFRDLLEPFFSDVTFLGQRLATGSLIFPLENESESDSYDAWTAGSTLSSERSTVKMKNPMYLIAVCSNQTVNHFRSSVYLDHEDDLYQEQMSVARWASSLSVEHEKLASAHKELLFKRNQATAERDALVAERDALVAERDALVAERDALVAEREALVAERDTATAERNIFLSERENLLNSTSWKLTEPVRLVGRGAERVKSVLDRPLPFVWSGLRRVYFALPMPHSAHLALKNRLFRLFPSLLENTSSYRAWKLASRSKGVSDHRPENAALVLSKKTRLPDEEELRSLSAFFSAGVSSSPKVSIIIPVYGQAGYTFMCLRSIARMTSRVSYEVIVVDDQSPDDSLVLLRRVDGLRVIANEKNLGFIRSCNAGAAIANGDYLVFLNNDTEVMSDWLDELIGTFAGIPDAGLVGSKLVYPDGTLQEAGGIIWKDGSAWNYGRGDDPSRPEYRYLREVDYCSGASIALERQFFHEVGGFDEHYLPAYAEDSDLAFKTRNAGKKVYYQPLSIVVHYEGVTSGTDINAGVKSYQVENARKLFERWKSDMELLEEPGTNIDFAKDRGRTGRILVLDHCTPTPDMDAGSVTVLNILRLLIAEGYQVTFIPEDNFLYMPGYTEALFRIGIEVLFSPYHASVQKHLVESGKRYDAVLLFRPLVAERHLGDVEKNCPGAKILYHASDLHFLRKRREAELEGSDRKLRESEQLKEQELDYFRRADATIVHSTLEQEVLSREPHIENVHVFPWAIDIPGTEKGFEERKDICFIGGYQHPPNVDAVIYFVDEIFPLLRNQLPDLKFHAIGSNPPDEIKQLASEYVIVSGYVEDLHSLMGKIRVAVAPIRYGAGIKGKVGTTLAAGLPCVATTVAAEGMELDDGSNILIADTEQEFSEAVLRLYTDEALWKEVSQNGIQFAQQQFGMESGLRTIEEVLRSVDLPCPGTVPVVSQIRKLHVSLRK